MASSEDLQGLDILYYTKEAGHKTLERIIMRMNGSSRAASVGGAFTWDLTTPRLKLKRIGKLEGTLAQQLVRLEARMEGIMEEEGSDNKMMAKKRAKKEKKV